MSKAKKNGNIKERLILAINAVKVKFGYWPADLGTIANVAAWHLTPFDLKKEKLVKVPPELIALQGAGCGR